MAQFSEEKDTGGKAQFSEEKDTGDTAQFSEEKATGDMAQFSEKKKPPFSSVHCMIFEVFWAWTLGAKPDC